MKRLHRPEGSSTLDVHRGDEQAASDTYAPTLIAEFGGVTGGSCLNIYARSMSCDRF